MIVVYAQKAPATVLEKLNNLFDSLHAAKARIEKMANSVADKMMQRTLRNVAQESCQYANELSGQIISMGGDPDKYFLAKSALLTDENEVPATETSPYNKAIIKECTKNELEMIKAYQEVLNESSLYSDLRNMIRYQLEGLTCGFLQIRLLNH